MARRAQRASPWSATPTGSCARSIETLRGLIRDERTLHYEFMSNLARTSRRDPHEKMAEVFFLDRNVEAQRFFSALEERSPEASEKIRTISHSPSTSLGKLEDIAVQTAVRLRRSGKLGIVLGQCAAS